MTCNAKIRPMRPINEVELQCGLGGPEGHTEHSAELKDYAFLGSKSLVHWFEDDRRTFRGEWQACTIPGTRGGCILPNGHRGSCAS